MYAHIWIYTHTVSLPYLQIYICGFNQLQTENTSKKKKKNSRKFQKAKLEFATHWQLFTYHLHCISNYLHSIYIVRGIISNLEMI